MFEKTKTIPLKVTLANGEVLNTELVIRRPTLKDRLDINKKRGMYSGNSTDPIAIYQAEVVVTVETLVTNMPASLNIDVLDASDFYIYEQIYKEITNWVEFFRKPKE